MRYSIGGNMRVSWDRARRIFNYPEPPGEVWEKQFDYNDEELRRLAATQWDQINFDDLWYYYHDLAYVELQPEVFSYLFPVCLMDWHTSLLNNESCSHGDSEFHRGLWHGQVLQKMATADQQLEIRAFFRDGFLDRLDMEAYPARVESARIPCVWLARFNSLATILPCVEMIWKAWWSLETSGQAIAALKYCAGLAYFDDENPYLGYAVEKARELGRRLGTGGAGRIYWVSDAMIHDVGWLPENLSFLRSALTTPFLKERAVVAAERLVGHPDYELAADVAAALPSRGELLKSRIDELMCKLENAGDYLSTWSV
jgi:hypothetical protein